MTNFFSNKFFIIFFAPFALGCLTTFSLPPYNFTLINFLVFPILLEIIFFIKNNKKFNKNYNFFYIGSSFSFSFFLFGIYWITISLTHEEIFKVLIPFALLLIPFFLSLFFGFGVLLIRNSIKKNIYFILIFSLMFSITEFLRGNLLTGFPWNLIAYTWAWSYESIQILSFIGTYSLSLFSITLFCLPFLFIKNKFNKKNIIFFFVVTSIFVINYLYGFNKLKENQYTYNENININIVSLNFSMKSFIVDSELERLKKIIKVSNPDKHSKTLFIWPEGFFSETYLQEIQKYKYLFKKNFSEKHLFVMGINNYDKSMNKYYNSLVVLNHNLDVLYIYNKKKLVPFGEFLPFEKLLHNLPFKKITQGYNSFSKGNERKIYNLGKNFDFKKILPLICYEIIYSGSIKNKNQFPDLVINISEDAWFGNSIGPHQHFTKAVYRAVEEGVFIARAANRGISSLIKPNGMHIKQLEIEKSNLLTYKFPIFKERTFFSIYQNKIFFLIIFMYIFLILFLKKKSNDKKKLFIY